jgi:hypothetical protein
MSECRPLVTGAASGDANSVLSEYPGTALTRMETARDRAASLTEEQLSGAGPGKYCSPHHPTHFEPSHRFLSSLRSNAGYAYW